MKRGGVVTGAAAAVLLAGGGAAAFVMVGEENTPAAASSAAPAATAEVTRSDLVDTEAVDGTLGYSDRLALPNHARGTVTRVRKEGGVVRRGGWLYRVDGRPVVLMYGDIPVYRTLSSSTSGKDVRQLERNLKALGYDPGTVDEDFTRETGQAVREWQDDAGLEETGTVGAAQVAVAPGAVRIAEVTAAAGTSAGQSVVTTTSTRRTVHVDLDSADQRLARAGAPVTVDLPGGVSVRGRIAEVGTVAEPVEQNGQPTGESTIDLEITLDDDGDLGRLDQAPVTVNLRSQVREDVLSVPVEALLALREGGYGVRLAGGRVIAVETGVFAAGRVEVSGGGLAEGAKVEVPET
ncbi:peptidoglycan-binding protein [Planobispora rosea]|uniref:Peptidoglycan-binding protein n=1 Tax=Planobispora rosea TaxID=35762 RepID=A0A8J3WEL4_PLARO|nr:peptidoglycan-binding domain-containing protein [Planobispora rosea]GGS66876.1 peptidoglycan-binding protein [Planobispora rosea]GIH85081.1 peptidoglycan-binding protein [Planobispora rosea]